MNLETAQINMQNPSLYVIYVNSSHLYAVRNPLRNNAIGNTFRKLNTYIVDKHAVSNQLVLTFYSRVTPFFMNSTRSWHSDAG